MKYERADSVGLLSGLGFRARRQKRMTPHRGRRIDPEGRPRDTALEARERAGRTRVEHRDPDIGRHLVQPVAQALIRHAVFAEQQALLVGMARVVEDDLGSPRRRAGRPLCSRETRGDRVERVEQFAELRLPEHDLVVGRNAAQFHHDAREALGVRHRVSQHCAIGAAEVRANHQRVALEGAFRRLGRRGCRHERRKQG